MSCKEWMEQHVKGRTFADVGGLWGTVNEKVTVAAKAGAAKTTMMDITPLDHELWKKFYDRCAQEGVTCDSSIQANVDDPDLKKKVGTYDVVHCAGVLYHCPHPLYTVFQLGTITKSILILGSTVIPRVIKNTAGEIAVERGSSLFVPAMDDYQRNVVTQFYKEVGASTMYGINPPLNDGWSLDNYVPWWHLFTADCIIGLLKVCGLTVEDFCDDWGGRAAYFFAVRK